MKSSEVVEFRPSPKSRGGTLTPSEKGPSQSDSDLEDDPLVSGPIELVTLPLELLIPSLGRRVKLRALLDSGCTRCLIIPTLVGKLGVHLKNLENPITFCQLDGSVGRSGVPATFPTEPLELTMGSHSETLIFIVVPRMEWPLVLGPMWLKLWNP